MYPHVLALHSSCSPAWQNCNISLIQSSTYFAATLKQLKGPGGKLTTGLTFLSLNYDLQTQGGIQYYPVISQYSLIHPSILQEGCSLVFISSEIFNTLCLSSFSALDFSFHWENQSNQKGMITSSHHQISETTCFSTHQLCFHIYIKPNPLFVHLIVSLLNNPSLYSYYQHFFLLILNFPLSTRSVPAANKYAAISSIFLKIPPLAPCLFPAISFLHLSPEKNFINSCPFIPLYPVLFITPFGQVSPHQYTDNTVISVTNESHLAKSRLSSLLQAALWTSSSLSGPSHAPGILLGSVLTSPTTDSHLTWIKC